MGAFYEAIPESLIKWILEQQMFWVATAPLSGSGHVNVSPKGGEYFGIIDARTFWYMELTGSGSETLAHLYEPGNGRITVMFSAFNGPPRIVRIFGKGRALENGTKEFQEFAAEHGVKTIPGTRSIIVVDVHQAGSSCGFSVPYYDFRAHRQTLNDLFRKRAESYEAGNEKDSILRYWAFKNAYSVDGLPSMKKGLEIGQTHDVEPMKKMVGPLAPRSPRGGGAAVAVRNVVVIALLSLVLGALLGLYGEVLTAVAASLLRSVRAGSRSEYIDWIPVVGSLAKK
ncbi:Pyridoxamine phosphate oxidase [Coniochaeta hoffmannii]|uniref:Pyridoxamine phosphate oxidase n=1 Tax=Coniochaeta hoffmannii TaxID=91930 RepID=A0AA38RZT0_9PEZI|nr:Pyridoxamine phosphate oxidase [Coniochaeta hoffmannii]